MNQIQATAHSLIRLALLGSILTGCGARVDGPAMGAQEVAVAVSPPAVQVLPGEIVGFSAAVTGTANTSVAWDVAEAGGGMVTAAGQYTAPGSVGQFHVRASSRADPSVFGTALVTVTATPTVSVGVSPSAAMVAVGGTQAFTAAVYGTTDTAVSWSVQEGTSCGSISAAGVYAAPATAATCHVVATSAADPTKSAVATVTVAAPSGAGRLRTEGRFLLDTCGNRLVIRGIEGSIGAGMEVHGTFTGYIDELAATGANAVRLLPDQAPGQPTTSATAIEAMVARAVSHGMVVYLSVYDNRYNDFVPLNVIQAFWSRADIKSLVNRYRKWMIVDGVQEIDATDCVAWRDEAISRLTWLRGQGYDLPTTAISAQRGRKLDCAVQQGAAVVAADPLHQVIIGVQMYWGTPFWIEDQGTVAQGIATAAQQSFPIQAGFDYVSDGGTTYVDYQGGMTAAETYSVGWLWWDYYNPFYLQQSLSTDGLSAPGHVSPFGEVVLRSHAASIAKTSHKACGL